jgi:hypothetical protein
LENKSRFSSWRISSIPSKSMTICTINFIKHVLRKFLRIDIAFAALVAGNAYAVAPEACDPGPVARDIQIVITKSAEGAVASYRFSEPVNCFRLADAGSVRKLTWKMLTAGTRLSENGNVVFMEKARTGFQVLLQPFQYDGQIDRTYSPVIVFGDGSSAAIYTAYLLGESQPGKMTFNYRGFSPFAPVGKIGHQSDVAGEHPGYLIVGSPMLVQQGKASMILDRALPVWLRAEVTKQLRQGVATLSSVAALPGKMSYLLTYTDPRSPGAYWRGDTLHQFVRLNFFGEKWQHEDPALAAAATRFGLHELFHLVNDRIRSGQPGDGSLSLLEGGAEAAAATLMHRSGELDDTGFVANMDSAIMRCLAVTGDTLADKERNNTRSTPYACGEMLQYLAASTLKKKVGQADMLAIWKALLSRQKGEPYGWDEFFVALRQEADPAALEQISMLEKLVGGTASWHETLGFFEARSVLRKRDDAELRRPEQSAFYAKFILWQMLEGHCNGRFGINSINADYILDAPPESCSGLPDKFRIVAMNGHRLADEGYGAYREQIRRCAAGELTELKDDPGEIRTATCGKAVRQLQLYSFGRNH